MGSSSKTTNSSQTSTQTSTPNAPSYVTSPLQSSLANISSLAGTNPQNYVAPASANQNQAYSIGGQTLGSTSPNYGAASAMATGNSSVGAGQIGNFLSPYLNGVVNSTLASYDQQQGQTLAQDAASAAANNAFGGSRYGVQEAENQQLGNLNRATLQSGLLNTGYNTAVSDAFQNANLGQSAATNLANIGSTQDADNRANLGTLDALGQDQRSISQAQATAPLSLAQAIQSLLSGSGVNAGDVVGQTTNGAAQGTSTTTSNPSIFDDITGALKSAGQIGSAASSIAAFF